MKKLFVALGLLTSIGLLGTLSIKHTYVVRAEDTSEEIETSDIETSEDLESYSEEEVSDEEIGSLLTTETTDTIYENISSTAKDVIEVIKEVFNQPIVIAGVSTTLGVLVVLVFTKLFSVLTKKKVNDCLEQIKELGKKVDESISKKQYDLAISQIKELKEVVMVLVESTKNVKVKDKALKLLEEIKPVVEEEKVFIEEKKDEVVEFTKEKVGEVSKHVDDSAKHIMDIVNKD